MLKGKGDKCQNEKFQEIISIFYHSSLSWCWGGTLPMYIKTRLVLWILSWWVYRTAVIPEVRLKFQVGTGTTGDYHYSTEMKANLPISLHILSSWKSAFWTTCVQEQINIDELSLPPSRKAWKKMYCVLLAVVRNGKQQASAQNFLGTASELWLMSCSSPLQSRLGRQGSRQGSTQQEMLCGDREGISMGIEALVRIKVLERLLMSFSLWSWAFSLI